MRIKTIKKSISIEASGKRVWEVLQNDNDIRKWYAAFKKGY